MFRLLSLSVPSLGGNKMATKRKKSAHQAATASASATIDLDQNEKEMDTLISEWVGEWEGGYGRGCQWLVVVRACSPASGQDGRHVPQLLKEWYVDTLSYVLMWVWCQVDKKGIHYNRYLI